MSGLVPFPWAEAMRFGFGVMKLAPRDFWAMTPRELSAAFGGQRSSGARALVRGDLDALMTQFPDGENKHG
jgi:uncharacterized phage protein (TIGR02216 family)